MTSKYTAPVRIKPSRAALVLEQKGLLVGEMLDFGCGRGFDADRYGMDKYDPNWGYPDLPEKQYDTISCHWVLNVVSENEQNIILRKIKNLLKPSGTAYLTVRRDIKKDYLVRDYIQRVVRLPLRSIKSSDFEIYIMKKDDLPLTD
jgi:ATP adenylyltransferase